MPRELVCNLRDNYAKVKFLVDESPLNLSNTTRVLVQFDGVVTVADTDVDPALVAWDEGAAGVLKFKLGFLGLPVGDYKATVVVFDSVNTNGQAIVHKDNPISKELLRFQVVN